jgi:hypothetical protein
MGEGVSEGVSPRKVLLPGKKSFRSHFSIPFHGATKRCRAEHSFAVIAPDPFDLNIAVCAKTWNAGA